MNTRDRARYQRDRAFRVPDADRVGADRLGGFSASMTHCRIGGCWATWSNSYTGDVYTTGATSVTMTLPDTNAFYFYAEPQQFANITFTATTANGTTSGPITVNGNSGARYFGFYTTGTSPLASVTVTTTDPTGFAIGEFGIAAPYQFVLPLRYITNPAVLTQPDPTGVGANITVAAEAPYYARVEGITSTSGRTAKQVLHR